MTDQIERKITIKREAFGVGFDVVVEPAPEGETFDREYPTFAGARGYARGLRMYRGWPIHDLTGEGVE